MTAEERRAVQIDKFLESFNVMLEEANKIDGFQWRIQVSISSDNELRNERVRTINGINKSFTDHEMSWNSSN